MKYFREGHQTKIKSSAEILAETVERMRNAKPGVPLIHYPNFSSALGGLRPHEFTILCGATGSGKTTLLANWGHDLLVARTPFSVFSVETGPHDFTRRVMAASIGEDIPDGPDPRSGPLVSRAMLKIGQMLQEPIMRLGMYEDRIAVEALMHDIEDEVEQRDAKVVFVDNLNFFLQVTNAADAIQEMDRVIHKLIIFCKDVPVHIVMVMHPKKTEEGRIKSEFDIKGSSTAVQEAHNVLLFNRPDPVEIKNGVAHETDREIKIVKARRRGLAVGKRFLIKTTGGVAYTEK